MNEIEALNRTWFLHINGGAGDRHCFSESGARMEGADRHFGERGSHGRH